MKEPDASSIRAEVSVYTKPIAIVTVTDYDATADDLKGIRALSEKIEGAYNPILESIRASEKTTREIRDGFLRPLKEQRQLIEAERYRWEKQQELERAQRDAESLRVAQQTQEAQAEAMDAMGLGDISEATVVPYVTPPLPAIHKSPGISKRENWKARVTDLGELILAVSMGKAPRECLIADQAFLNTMAKKSKRTLKIPGLEVYEDRPVTSVRIK